MHSWGAVLWTSMAVAGGGPDSMACLLWSQLGHARGSEQVCRPNLHPLASPGLELGAVGAAAAWLSPQAHRGEKGKWGPPSEFLVPLL